MYSTDEYIDMLLIYGEARGNRQQYHKMERKQLQIEIITAFNIIIVQSMSFVNIKSAHTGEPNHIYRRRIIAKQALVPTQLPGNVRGKHSV